jgi:hypothetical protein
MIKLDFTEIKLALKFHRKFLEPSFIEIRYVVSDLTSLPAINAQNQQKSVIRQDYR